MCREVGNLRFPFTYKLHLPTSSLHSLSVFSPLRPLPFVKRVEKGGVVGKKIKKGIIY